MKILNRIWKSKGTLVDTRVNKPFKGSFVPTGKCSPREDYYYVSEIRPGHSEAVMSRWILHKHFTPTKDKYIFGLRVREKIND